MSASETEAKRGMRLGFPNISRSFDEARNRIRFWGYDRALEIAFFIEEDALRKLDPQTDGSEANFLRAFDAARGRIHEAADRAYMRSRGRSQVHSLTAEDF